MGEIQKYLHECLNCGNPLHEGDKYCGKCGQRTRGAKVPIKDFIGDFLQDYFTVDSKLFRSVLLLLSRPGKLTRSFNDGKRRRFIAPFRMYLFVSFVYFFLLSLTVKDSTVFEGFDTARIKDTQLALLDSAFSSPTGEIDLEQLKARMDSVKNLEEEGDIKISLDSAVINGGSDLSDFWNEHARRAADDPKSFMQSLFRVVSISLFFLLPLFALVLWFFHLKKGLYYVQHLVHGVHLHTFVFTVFSIYLLLNMWIENSAGGILSLIIFVYMIWSLKVVYSQSILAALIKTIAILFVYSVILIFAIIPAFLGALVMN